MSLVTGWINHNLGLKMELETLCSLKDDLPFSGAKVSIKIHDEKGVTPWKMNMEPKDGGLEDYAFRLGDF